MDKDKKLVELLQNLVKIPSWVSDDETEKWITNENNLVDYIEKWLRKNTDLNVIRQKLDYGRFNLIASKGNPEIIFLAHTDTVAPPANPTYSAFGAEVRDGKVWGRGTADMKCGIAALMQAAILSPDADNYAMIFYADEEYDFLGMKSLIKECNHLKPHYLISADGADLKMGNACRGLIEIRFRVKGKSAHAATGQGINAIEGVYKITEGVKTFLAKNAHKEMGVSSFNLAYVFGGNGLGADSVVDGKLLRVGQEGNVVPNIAEVVIDIRPSSPDISAKIIVKEMQSLALKEGLVLEIVNERHDLGAWFTDKSELREFEKIAQKVCRVKKIEFNDFRKSGYLDLQMFWEATGKPTAFVFGAGSGKTEHTDEENVEIENLVKTRDFFVEVLAS